MIAQIFYTIIFMFILSFVSLAQESISADVKEGCDSLEVNFNLENAYDPSVYSSVEWKFGDGNSAVDLLEVAHYYTTPGVYDSVICILDGLRIIEFNDTIFLGRTPFADFVYGNTSENENQVRYIFESRNFVPVEGIDLTYSWNFIEVNSGLLLSRSSMTGSRVIYDLQDPDADTLEIKLSLTDVVGCSADTTRIIEVITNIRPDSLALSVPNAFSPNYDGINDNFRVITLGEDTYLFSVFSTEGMQVFRSESPVIVWNGRTYDGSEAREGVYFYVIESRNTGKSKKGFIYLFR
ncbi:MAG: gliding motility-associated C-terminal domain-containing protein [Bacteroidales bacterium]|nr:gliding motility-associated C-terminal domain-containing protein [Bacteroidales bacterium]